MPNFGVSRLGGWVAQILLEKTMKYSSLKVVATIIGTILLSSSVHAYEQDMNFGTEGFAYAETTHSSIPHAINFTQDGRIVSVGRSIVDNKSGNFALNITDSEGNNVITTESEITTKRDVAHKVLSLSNGNLLVLGEANAHAAGALYDSEGNLLGSYISPDNHSFYRDAVEQEDGKIVVVGYQRFDDLRGFSVIATRFNADYSVDTTYGVDGVFQDPFRNVDSNYNSLAYAVDIQDDGKVVLGVHVYHLTDTTPEFNEYSVLVRLTTSGMIDTTFGTSEALPLTILEDFVVRDVKVDASGAIFAAGKSSTNARVIKALSDGSALDTTFCGNGIAEVDTTEGTEGFMALVVQDNGGVLATGYSGNETVDLLLASFDAQGNPGHYFETETGFLVLDYGDTDYGRDLIQNESGELFVTANIAHNDYSKDMVLIKFIESGNSHDCDSDDFHHWHHWHHLMCHIHKCFTKIHLGMHAYKESLSKHHMDFSFKEELDNGCLSKDLDDKYEHHHAYAKVDVKHTKKHHRIFHW